MHLVLNGEKREDSEAVMVGVVVGDTEAWEEQKWGMVGKAFCEVMVHLRDSTLLPLPIPIRR